MVPPDIPHVWAHWVHGVQELHSPSTGPAKRQNKLIYPDSLTFPKPCTTTYGLNPFTYTAARFWNALPNRLRTISCLNDFIRAIRQHELIF